MKIVVLDADTVSAGDIDFGSLKALGDVKIYGYTEKSDIIKNIGDADAIICNKTPITKDVIEACTNLKYIGLFATGYNNIDLQVATEHNIVVSNVPEYSTDAVAQHVFAFILNHFSRIDDYAKTVENGDWVRSKLFSYFNLPTHEISGLTLGIVGFGSIGRKVAGIAQAFGMNVIVFTRTIPDGYDNIKFVSLDELLKTSDVVTFHCPLNEQTKEVVCERTLSQMKKSAVFINTARGGIVNESNLAKALNNNVIAKAYLDVVAVEPMLENNPLRNAKNCVITPHIAWAPLKTRQRLVKTVIDNYIAFENNTPQNIVNKGSVK